eukprot:scaffold62153_cov61-Phaeocystis_antarctica.AAC.17
MPADVAWAVSMYTTGICLVAWQARLWNLRKSRRAPALLAARTAYLNRQPLYFAVETVRALSTRTPYQTLLLYMTAPGCALEVLTGGPRGVDLQLLRRLSGLDCLSLGRRLRQQAPFLRLRGFRRRNTLRAPPPLPLPFVS